MLTKKQKIDRALDAIRNSISDVERAMSAEAKGHEKQGITLAEKVKALRERGLTQTEIAKEIGSSQARVSNILGSFKEWRKEK